MRIPASLLVHQVQVRPYLGESSVGATYGPEFTLQCMAQGGVRLVRGGDGNQTVSSLTLYAAPDLAATIPAGSEVDHAGDTTTVLTSINHDSGGLGAPDHTEVVCE